MDELLEVRPRDSLVTNRLGEIAVAKVVLRAIEKEVRVSRPLMECRYDLVLDDGLKLYRRQVKYAGGSSPKQCQGALSVGLRQWRQGGRVARPCYTTKEIDLLLVYVRRLDRILWFGPEVFDGRAKVHFRIEPSRNNQRKGCRMAADYLW